MTIQDIMARKSVRQYSGEPLRDKDAERLRGFIDELNETAGVFGNTVRLRLLEGGVGGGKLGTYGVIRGARSFVAAACGQGAYALEDVGYQFEKLILFATGLKLGTVILGGTFSRGGFAKAMELRPGETLPVVSPVGYKGGKKSLLGSLIKSNAGNRKPWSELFFDGGFSVPLSPDDPYKDALEAVRQAPSTRNVQPWRIVKDEGAFHFYSAGAFYMHRIDMGIALCHYEIAAREKGFGGGYKVLQRMNVGGLKYLVSWRGDH